MKLTSAGKKMTAAVTVPLVAMATVGIKKVAEYDDAVRQVIATLGDTENYDKIDEASREAGATTRFTAAQAAEAMNLIAQSGKTLEESMDLLPKTLDLAAAGGLDLAKATSLLTDGMTSLGETNVDKYMDQMAVAAQKSNTSIGLIGESLLTVGGTAKKLKGGLTEANTALGPYLQSQGAHDAYQKDEYAIESGKVYRCKAAGTVWPPSQVAANWELVK